MQGKASVKVQLLLLTAIGGVFTVNVLMVMIGPLLVDMARDLKVSVAVAGQLIAFMAVPWLIVAVLSGLYRTHTVANQSFWLAWEWEYWAPWERPWPGTLPPRRSSGP